MDLERLKILADKKLKLEMICQTKDINNNGLISKKDFMNILEKEKI